MTTGGRCARGQRPATLCWCAELVPVPTATRVLILQHPRERHVRIGTARLVRCGLANAELRLGVRFDDDARVQRLAGESAALLYPGGATDLAAFASRPPATLVVVDGTWCQARKVVARNPVLGTLPRLGIDLGRPGRYRIRREPAPHCLSTVEAVVEALVRIEGDGERFAPLLAAFDTMVETQLRCAAEHPRPYVRAPRRYAVA